MTTSRWWMTIALASLVGNLELACLRALSPHEEVKPETTTTVEADHSTVTQTTFNFQSVAAKGGWIATPLTLLGWVVATIKAKRREQAADIMIQAIESCGHDAILVKSQVRRKANPYIDARVKRLTNPKPAAR